MYKTQICVSPWITIIIDEKAANNDIEMTILELKVKQIDMINMTDKHQCFIEIKTKIDYCIKWLC